MKTSILTLLSALFFVACSDNQDKSPPSLKDFQEELSIFDTLMVQFSQTLKGFDSTSYIAEPELNCWSSGKYVKCVGVGIYPDAPIGNKGVIGTPSLVVDTTYELTFVSIEDKEGNDVEGRIELEFSTHLHLDTDFENDQGTTNDQLIDADSIGDNKNWVDESPVTEAFVFSGFLEDKNQSGLANDHQDVYFLYLNAQDSISLSVSGYNQDIKLSFVGPIEFGTDQVPLEYYDTQVYRVNNRNKMQKLNVYIDGNRHITGIDTDSETKLGVLKYWVSVTYETPPETDENRPSPYTLTAKVVKD